MIPIEIAQYFQRGLDIIILILSFIAYNRWNKANYNQLRYDTHTNWFVLILFCLILSILIGLRPFSARYFGDTVNYACTYGLSNVDQVLASDWTEGDWLFRLFQAWCSERMNASCFFTIIMLGYVFFTLIGIKRLFENSSYGAVLFCMGAFSFFSYATNGIRNGLAASMFIMGMAMLLGNNKKNVLGVLICISSIFIHKSMLLPALSFVVAHYVKEVKSAVYLWFISIILYLFASGPISNFFANMGYDDRLSSYITNIDEYAAMGYKTGFRMNFLIYSFMPIWLGIVVVKRCNNIGTIYPLLLKTYIIANSFWVMLMNASYSNRFAYLSWFLLPIIIAFPCLKLDVWGSRQGRFAGLTLIAHTGFTIFMLFIYY